MDSNQQPSCCEVTILILRHPFWCRSGRKYLTLAIALLFVVSLCSSFLKPVFFLLKTRSSSPLSPSPHLEGIVEVLPLILQGLYLSVSKCFETTIVVNWNIKKKRIVLFSAGQLVRLSKHSFPSELETAAEMRSMRTVRVNYTVCGNRRAGCGSLLYRLYLT